MSNTPFPTNSDGQFLVTQPLDGAVPEAIEVTLDEKTWRLTGYVGKKTRSRIYPEILQYEHCEPVEKDDGSYRVVD